MTAAGEEYKLSRVETNQRALIDKSECWIHLSVYEHIRGPLTRTCHMYVLWHFACSYSNY